ncbi:MAG: hypothetical protein IT381_24345 [Deltaproteobacteria bacterium]|nr:hypothetical protein [Deltaproteobacteria bacterium]
MKKTALVLSALLLAPAAFAEDKDPAAAMKDLGDQLAMENPEGGGSIRAKKDPDTSAATRKADKKNVQARVTSIKKGTFPQVALVLKVTKPAEDGPNKDKAAKDAQIIVVPTYKAAGKTVDLSDAPSVLNAGAYYLAEGDNVYVRLDAQDGKVWKAGYIERR